MTAISPRAGNPDGAKPSDEGGASQQGGSGNKGLHWMLVIDEGELIGAPDGNVYLLRATSPPCLYSISPAGMVVRAVTAHLDAPGLSPTGMSQAGEDQALIEFDHCPTGNPSGDNKYDTVPALVNLASGDVTGTFGAPAQIFPSACATPQGEFLFLGASKQGNLDVVKFAAPGR